MSFWGPSNTQRNDQGAIGEIPNWSFGNAKNWLGWSNNAYGQGQNLYNQIIPFYQNLMQNGGPSVQQNWDTGRQVMPGIPEALQTQQNNLSNIWNQWSNFSDPSNPFSGTGTWNDMRADTDLMNQNTMDTYGKIGTDIGSTYGTAQEGAVNLNQQLMEAIKSLYGGTLLPEVQQSADTMQGWTSGAYDPLKSGAKDLYNSLLNSSGSSFSNSRKTLEGMKPGGQLQTALVAQNFAPQVSSTLDSLRRAGVDPNSPQAQEAIANITRGRGEAMDKASADALNSYISSNIGLNTQEQQNKQGLGQWLQGTLDQLAPAELNTKLGIESNRAGTQEGLQSQQGQLERSQNQNLYNTLTGLDLSKLNANTSNNLQYQDQQNNVIRQMIQNALVGRNMNLQDFGIGKDLVDEQTQAALKAPLYQYQQYQAGFNQDAYDQALKQAAAQGLTGEEARQFALAQSYGQMGQSSLDQALRGFLTSYGLESQNAGWGLKTILGALGPLLSIFGGGGMNIPMDLSPAGAG